MVSIRVNSVYVGMPEDDPNVATVICRAMIRKLIWVEQQRFRGFGCSECGWRFESSETPSGKSFEEMMRNFESQRDKAFRSHVCADHRRAKNTEV